MYNTKNEVFYIYIRIYFRLFFVNFLFYRETGLLEVKRSLRICIFEIIKELYYILKVCIEYISLFNI